MNAIILAAGLGTRLRPLTNDTPKALVKVNGQPIIEKQIEYLKNIGINEIIIVTGYLHEKFNYLVEKYDVKLIFNDKYDIYNNAYTMYLVRDYLQDSFVLEGDVYLTNNILVSNLKKSTYFGGIKEGFTEEWILDFDSEDNLVDITIGSGDGYIMTGISYWNVNDGKKLKKMLEDMVKVGGFSDLFWDKLIKDNLKDFNIDVYKIKSNDWVEIDSVKDLRIAESI